MRLWDLPGARRFMDATCNSLRDGSSVVICFPSAVPEGFDDALLDNLGNALEVRRLTATVSPLEDLSRQYARHPSHVNSISDLCDDPDFRGLLVRLDNLNEGNWPAWRDFLGRYAQTSRSRHLLGRSLFLVPLARCAAFEPPPTDVALTHRTWDSILDDVDLLLFASERLRQRSGDTLLRSLLANIVARVASWDFDTAAALLAKGDRTILDPTEFLRAIARRKGWTADTPLDWQLGTESRSGVAHAARAALDNPPSEVNRRLWSAQLSVLLPWIEYRRYETVANNLKQVRRQMHHAGNGSNDPFEFEVADLASMFRQANHSLYKIFEGLRRVRNKLAHQEHLTPDGVLRLIRTRSL